MDILLLLTFGVLLAMVILSCLACVWMKFSDYKMKHYIMQLANTKGVEVDLEKIDKNRKQSPLSNENCAIFVPDVGIII